MYRRLLIVVTGLALLGSVAGCGGTTETSGPPLPAGSFAETIQKRGKLIIGTKFDQPGFGSKSMADEPKGFDVEVGKLIAKGIFGDDIEGKVQFEEARTDVREAFLEKGTVDIVVATYSITDERKKKVDFAGPYLIAGQGLLVKKSDNSINAPQDLAGKKVCSAPNSTTLKRIIEMVPTADVSLVFPNYRDCVEALKDGRLDAVTTDDQILLGYAADDPEVLKVVGKPFSQEKYGVGVKKDDKAWRDFVNDQLQKAYDNGTWAKAYADTIGAKTGVPVPPAPPLERY